MSHWLRTPLGHAYRTLRAPKYYRRAKRILADFSAHHAEAQAAFVAGGGHQDLRVRSLGEVGVRVLTPGVPGQLLDLADGHAARVAGASREVDRRFVDSADCTFFPPVASPLPDRVSDIPEIGEGRVIAARLKSPLDLPDLEAIAAPILEQLEQRVYGSFVLADKVYVYRSLAGSRQAERSWLWHFDNHPREILKVMIYLTDVTARTAPFQYLRDARSGAPVAGAPLAPLYGSSRVPNDVIDRHLAAGFEIGTVTGPKGTTLLFDDNVVHRAVLAEDAHRDVLVFQVRPALFKARPFVDPRWTGSFEHADFREDPAATAPTTQHNMVFQRT